MLRKCLVLILFYFTAQAFPSHDEPSETSKLMMKAYEIAIKTADGKPSIDNAINACSAQFPQIPEGTLKDAKDPEKLFKAASDNVPGVRCFIVCFGRILDPDTFTEDGEVNFDKLPSQPTEPVVKSFEIPFKANI